MAGASTTRSSRHLLARRRDPRRRQQPLGDRRRPRCVVVDAPARRRRDPRVVGRTGGQGDPLHPRPRRPRPGRAGPARRRTAPILLHPADRPLWELTHPRAVDVDLSDGQRIQGAGTTLGRCTPRARTGRGLLLRAGLGASSPATPCSRAAPVRPAGRSATRPDPGLDPGRPATPPGRHRGPHRSRRRHHDRRGGGRPV